MDQEGVISEPLIDVDPPADPATPAPAADDQKAIPAATDENAEVAETPEQQEAKKQSRNQRRFERQKTARIQAETRAQMLEQQLAELKSQRERQPESGEPQREQFQDYESYLRAVAKHDAKQEAAATLKADREERQGKEVNAGQQKLTENWKEREKAFQATAKDYDEVVTPYVEEDLGRLSDGARRLIVESDIGPQLLHHLAANSEVHDHISGLSPVKQVAELGKLEDKLVKPPAKKASDAPPPVKPVAQGRGAPNGYSENMSNAEYKAWRKGNGARWAQR